MKVAQIEVGRLSLGGVLMKRRDSLSAEINRLEKLYLQAPTEKEAKDIARRQNRLSNEFDRLTNAISEYLEIRRQSKW